MTPFAAVNPMPMSASPRAATLQAALEQRILVLDGAMGTMIQRHKLEEADYRGARFADWAHDLKGNNDLLVLTQPDIIRDIHRQYLEAGADLIETNTFNAQTISLADYHMESLAHEMNVAAARLAREAADAVGTPARPRFVAGAIGPTNRTASISPDVNDPGKRNVSYQQLVTAYLEQVRGLAEGGVDLFLIETIFDTLNAKAAIFACETFFEETGTRYPVILSGTITDASGRTLSGQTTAAFWASVRHAQPLAVGFNCALGGKDMRPYIAELAALADCGISCYPNAGLPNAFGEYDELPEDTAAILRGFAEDGLVNIVGGCCGTTPDHIAAIAGAVADVAPRPPVPHQPVMRLSGLEPLTVTTDLGFVNVGERTNVTGSAAFRKLIKEGDYAAALTVARQQVEAGAQVIDVNMDEGMLDGVEAMRTFDIELTKMDSDIEAATANLNGLPTMFAVLDSVVIVRCDVPTDAAYSKADAGLFLAANQINSVAFGARAVISEHDDMLVVRTERDIPAAAGMNDEQLQAALKSAVDGVIRGQDAMVSAAEEMAKLGSETAAKAGEEGNTSGAGDATS